MIKERSLSMSRIKLILLGITVSVLGYWCSRVYMSTGSITAKIKYEYHRFSKGYINHIVPRADSKQVQNGSHATSKGLNFVSDTKQLNYTKE